MLIIADEGELRLRIGDHTTVLVKWDLVLGVGRACIRGCGWAR